MIFKKLTLIVIVVLLFSSCPNTMKPIVSVVITSGQSNATEHWAEGISTEIKKFYPDTIFVHHYVGGEPMAHWFDGVPDARLIRITEQIDPYLEDYEVDIKALYWFQGESDAIEEGILKYEERFDGMVDYLKTNYDQADASFTVHFAQIYANPDVEDERHETRMVDEFRALQQEIADRHDDYFLYDSAPYARKDFWHLYVAEAYRLGADMVKTYYLDLINND